MLFIKAKMEMMMTIPIHEDIMANNEIIKSWYSNLWEKEDSISNCQTFF